jgi:hypothetical protein
MFIQFEACVDCLKVVYSHFDFAFLDNSQGHAKKLSNGFDAYSMNKGLSGILLQMHESIIKQCNGYLGSYSHTTLNVGYVQSFTIFQSTNDRPFWMSLTERELNCHSQIFPSPPACSPM